MAWIIGDTEKNYFKLGHIVATLKGRSFRCWQCEKGLLVLTRTVSAEGSLSPAVFVCDHCEDEVNIYPDKGGGVQPALKMNMRGKGFSADTVGDPNDGGWR